jgi:hypothetical protein
MGWEPSQFVVSKERKRRPALIRRFFRWTKQPI